MEKAKRIFLSLVLMFAVTAMYAQTEITGTVLDEFGEGVIGATVMEKGTSNGTVTDFDGNFKLKVEAGRTLVFSYIGYEKQELPARQGMTVNMKDNAKELAEVVVTGYQVQRKADLTGSVAVMDMKGPKSEGDPNILNSMQGKMPGVNIVTDAQPGGAGSTIRIRGMASANGGDPLYIIDGVASTDGNLSSLNAADIESLQVLKDASSASIYGSRAANGVVIITTKKGKGDKMAINLSYNASVQTVAKTHDLLNSEQWGRAYWQAAANDGLAPVAASTLYGTGETPQLVGSINGHTAADTDWQKEVYNSAWTHNLSASISNASDKGSFMFSGNYINQGGMVNETFYRRFSSRVNSTYNFNKYIRVGENLMVAYWQKRGAGEGEDGIAFNAMRQHPALPVYRDNGAFGNAADMFGSDISNPAQTLFNQRDNSDNSWRIFGNAYIDIMPISGLTIKSNLGIEHSQYFTKVLGRKVRATDSNSNSSVRRDYGQGDTWTWTNTANYLFDINGNHHFNALLGTEAIKYVSEGLWGFRNGYVFEDADYMQLGADAEGTKDVGGSRDEWALFSIFGKLDYNYADRYLFSATLRRDQSSRLSDDHNTGIFPAFSGAWRVSEEKFWPKNNVVGDLKVRAAWGQNGNSWLPNNYPAYTTYGFDTGNAGYDLNATGTGVKQGVKILSTGNPDLKWETTTQTNLGFDAYLLNGSISLAFDYYWKTTKDMITFVKAPATAGESADQWMNTGKMKNHGFELNIGYRSPQYGDFSWDGNLNLSAYRNEVVKLNDDNVYQQAGMFEGSGGLRLQEGEPMGVYFGYVCDGIFQNEDQVLNHAQQAGKGVGRLIFRDIDGNGLVDADDRCIIGDPNPDFSMGLTLTANYKNWSLSTFFSGDFGFDIINTTRRQLEFISYGNTYTNRGADVLDAWRPDNTGASIPALTTVDDNNERRMSTYFVEDGSYLKCKYLKLSYAFDQPWMKTIGLSAMSIYGQVDNVFTITGYKGLDPEVPMSTYGSRLDAGPYPRARVFSLGLSVQF